jgi:hypothetical protein
VSSQDDRKPAEVMPLWLAVLIVLIMGTAVGAGIWATRAERSQDQTCAARGGSVARAGQGHYLCIAPDGRVIGHG